MEKQVFFDFGLRFNLRQTKLNKPTIIYAVFMWEGVQYKVNTSVKVYPAHWDNKLQNATVSNRLSKLINHNNRIVNKRISEIITSISNLKLYLCEHIESNVFELIINSINSKKKNKMKHLKVEKMTSFLKEMLELKPTKANSKYISNINGLMKFLEENEIDDNLELLDGDLLNNYQKWFVKKEKTLTCIRQYIQDLKTLINRGTKSRKVRIDISTLEILDDLRSREQKKSKQVPLTEQQVLDIYNLDNLSDKEEEARDLFICQCLLGQRISDMPKIFKGDYITNKHDGGGETITFNVQKTKEEATIFLFPIAKTIIEKYRNKIFHYYNILETDEKKKLTVERTVNKTIKEVCKKAGLTAEISYTVQIGETIKSERRPLYQLMHTHIARHTFITLMCKMGVPKEIVIIATAHTDTKMIDEVYLHETSCDKGEKFIKVLQKVENKSKLFIVSNSSQNTMNDVLNHLFAYDLLIHINNLLTNNIDAFHMDCTQKAITIIKDLSTLDNYSNEVDIDTTNSLDKMVFDLSYYFLVVHLYSIFQYKEQYFGIINSVASYDDVNIMFANEDIERPKQQLESDIEEYEKYLKGE